MKKHILVGILFSFSLFAQVEHVLSRGHEWIVFEDIVYQRTDKQRAFRQAIGLPAAVISPTSGQVKKSFDGDHLYVTEEVGAKALRVRYAEKIDTPHGPRWFWRPSIVMKGNLRFIAADHRQVLIEERDVIDKSGTRMTHLLLLDLVDETRRAILSVKDPERTLNMEAVAKDGDFVVFTNTGSIYQLNRGETSLKELETDFLHKISNNYIDSEMDHKGGKVPQPPRFLGSPFFSTTGTVFVPMTIRERNKWSEKAVQAAFDQLPVEEKNKLIEAGKWPLKTVEYEGSDYVFALVSYTRETHSVVQVPPETLGGLVRAEPSTGQYRLAKPEWPSLTEVGEGRFLSVKEALRDVPHTGAKP